MFALVWVQKSPLDTTTTLHTTLNPLPFSKHTHLPYHTHLPIMHTHTHPLSHTQMHAPPPPPPHTHTHTSFLRRLYIPTHLDTHTWMHIHPHLSPLHTHTYQFLQETVSVLAAFQWTHFPAEIQNTTVPSHNTEILELM